MEGEEAIDVGTTSAAHRCFGQGWASGVVDEPIWISYEDLESVAAPSGKCRRQKPQRFIRAFRALHISRSSTRLSPSDPSAQLLRVRSGQTLPRPSTSNTILTAWFQSLSPYLHARDSPPLSTRGSVFRREMPAVAKASGGGTALPHL